MSLSTSIVNGAKDAYQTLAHAGNHGIVWLKNAAATTGDSAVKLAVIAKGFFSKALTQSYNMSKAYATVALKLAKANPFIAGAAAGVSAGIALTLLVNKYRAPATH